VLPTGAPAAIDLASLVVEQALNLLSVGTMEVCLVSNNGVPDDAVISVRAGTVRKQGTMGASKSFAFPTGEENRLKFDVMSRIGSGNVVLKPASIDASSLYKVTLSPSMSCEVQIKRSGEHPPVTNLGIEDSPVKISAAAGAKEAKDYLESKGLLSFLQGVLHVVIKDKPDDPYTFMARCFMNGFDDVPHATGGEGVCQEKTVDSKIPQASVHKEGGETAKGKETLEHESAPRQEVKELEEVNKEESAPPDCSPPAAQDTVKSSSDTAAAVKQAETPAAAPVPASVEAPAPPVATPAVAASAPAPIPAPASAPAPAPMVPAQPSAKEVAPPAKETAPAKKDASPAPVFTTPARSCAYAPLMAHSLYAPEAPMMVNYHPMHMGAACPGMAQTCLFI